MSKINFTADGSIINNNRIIESMADAKPLDYFNLSGNLKLAGSIRATDFIKEDGTSLPSVTVNKLALPENVYYMDKKLGINQDKPMADLDVKGRARVLGELGVEGSMGVSGNLVGKGSAAFSGKVVAEDELLVGKSAVFGGSVLSRGRVVAEDELLVGKSAVFGGSVLSRGRVVAEDELLVGKNAVFAGRINAGNAILLGGQEIPHPDVGDGALYRADGQVQIATDDLIRLRHVGSKATGIQFDVSPGAGDIGNPNGQMKITRQGIMFGGPNENREGNSAQISAGLHHANSLNIVGMSADKGSGSRRVDMWAEGGFSVFGPQKINGPRVDTEHVLNKQTQPSGQSVNSRGGWIASDMGLPSNQTRVVIGNLGNRATVGAHSAQLNAWAPLHLNPEGDQNVVIGGSDGAARLAVKGTGHEHGTMWLRSDKGPNVSHVHWGPTGDWYIRSAKPDGTVHLQDTGGIVRIAGAPTDANGQQLTIGNTNESNLRLGRHPNYSWIQSHGSRPLKINPLGNQVHLSDIGSDSYLMVDRFDASGIDGAIKNSGRKLDRVDYTRTGNQQAPGCPSSQNWAAICPAGTVQVGLTHSCNQFYPVCRRLNA